MALLNIVETMQLLKESFSPLEIIAIIIGILLLCGMCWFIVFFVIKLSVKK